MESNKDMGWYLDVDCACDAFSFSMIAMLALSCCLFMYLNVALRLHSVPTGMKSRVTHLNLPCFLTLLKVVVISI